MEGVRVGVLVLPGRPAGLPLPARATAHAAGFDVVAAERVELAPLARRAVGTGLTLEIPPGFEAQVRPRSGLALKHGITVLNAPGTIDADYRGELKVLLVNLGSEAYTIALGDRIAQLVFAPVAAAALAEVQVVSATARGSRGFGHTGR